MAIHEGTFESDGETYNYKTVEWKEEGGELQTDITDDDLLRVDYMLVEVTNDNDETRYQTINGPMDDWEFVEDILGYDWGDEGSRAFT